MRHCSWCGVALPESARVMQKYHRNCQSELQRTLSRNYFYVRYKKADKRLLDRSHLCHLNQGKKT